MFRVARRYRFSASHRLHSPELSDAENQALYGKCNNPFGHGHDYILEVVVKGDLDPRTGMVVPLKQLDDYVRQSVLVDFDHKYMNQQVEAFRDTPPTTENLATEIRRRLTDGWNASLHPAAFDRIRILETRRNSVELAGEEQ